mgnify:FL=1|jgi:uncharacterized Zn-binding protein involved in type VI secretion|tara:strand:+ start:54 stop:320 length:267 start_codon:yes stop_codon:yes gene_type:complete
MSLCVARYGDVCGGAIFAGASTVLTNGRPTAQIYNPVAGHGDCPHCAPVTVGASSTVYAEGQPVHRFSDACSCGHSTSTGSPNVFAGG